MSEFFEPVTPVERDGDVISGADYESLEQILPVDSHDDFADEIASRAVVAADEIITSYGTEPSLRALDAILNVEDEPTEVTKAYEAAADIVEGRRGQGGDATAAWYQLDPTGKIRKDYERQESMKQAALNHLKVEEIRKAAHDEKVAEIEKMLHQEDRERAYAQLLAEERVAERRRNSRA